VHRGFGAWLNLMRMRARLISRSSSIAEQASSQPPLVQFKNLIQFLNVIQDDPTDCVSSAATDRIRKAERRQVALEVGGQTIAPDWIFQAAEIQARRRAYMVRLLRRESAGMTKIWPVSRR